MSQGHTATPHWVFEPPPYRRKLGDKRDESRCAVHVFSGRRQDMGGHQCANKPTTTREGYPVCGKHSAEAEAQRKAKQDERYAAESAANSARYERERHRDKCEAAHAGLVKALELVTDPARVHEVERQSAMKLWVSPPSRCFQVALTEKELGEIRSALALAKEGGK